MEGAKDTVDCTKRMLVDLNENRQAVNAQGATVRMSNPQIVSVPGTCHGHRGKDSPKRAYLPQKLQEFRIFAPTISPLKSFWPMIVGPTPKLIPNPIATASSCSWSVPALTSNANYCPSGAFYNWHSFRSIALWSGPTPRHATWLHPFLETDCIGPIVQRLLLGRSKGRTALRKILHYQRVVSFGHNFYFLGLEKFSTVVNFNALVNHLKNKENAIVDGGLLDTRYIAKRSARGMEVCLQQIGCFPLHAF